MLSISHRSQLAKQHLQTNAPSTCFWKEKSNWNSSNWSVFQCFACARYSKNQRVQLWTSSLGGQKAGHGSSVQLRHLEGAIESLQSWSGSPFKYLQIISFEVFFEKTSKKFWEAFNWIQLGLQVFHGANALSFRAFLKIRAMCAWIRQAAGKNFPGGLCKG